jgi:hypothetical protein
VIDPAAVLAEFGEIGLEIQRVFRLRAGPSVGPGSKGVLESLSREGGFSAVGVGNIPRGLGAQVPSQPLSPLEKGASQEEG